MQNYKLPDEGYVRLKQLIGVAADQAPIIPVSSGTIWNWVREGKFPKPVKLSESITAWRVEDVREFLLKGGIN